MIRKFLMAFATVAVAAVTAGTAGTYKVDLPNSTQLDGQQLTAGHYKIDVVGNNAVFHNGKKEATVPVKVETASSKFGQTQYLYNHQPDGTLKLEQINVGGSHTTLAFSE